MSRSPCWIERLGFAWATSVGHVARYAARVAALPVVLPIALGLGLPGAHAHEEDSWAMFGQNLQNTAYAGEKSLRNAARLAVKWSFTTGGDVSVRPAVVDDTVYFPDWAGNLFAVDAKKGKLRWQRKLSDYGLTATTYSRTTPAVAGGVLYIGTQEGAWLLAIEAKSGKLLWKTQLESPDNDPFAVVTAAPVVVDGVVYTGVASTEEGIAGIAPFYPCCRARGSVVAVHAKGPMAGAVLWRLYTAPPGYSGAGVWGSNFAVDARSGTLYASTGNNYSKPTDPAYWSCRAAGGSAAACNSPLNFVDAVLALDMKIGAIKWARRFVEWNSPFSANGSDDWNRSCGLGNPPGVANCPVDAGADYDFASAPNLITYTAADGSRKTIVGAGQKSGIYFALDPATGHELWRTQVGPGSPLGGMQWGSASDGKRIYVANANADGIPTLVGSAGSWAALDPATGAILWQVADPNGAITLGPVTVAGNTVFVSSMAGAAAAPTMLALNAATGQQVWAYAAGSSVNAGPAVVDGVVYWGAGYARLGAAGYTGNNKLFAFSVDGK